jgi:hypothetical protein
MVQIKSSAFGIGAIIDAVGGLLGGGGDNPTQPVPREKFPRTLFIWGLTRILPVVIESMTIVEKQFDTLLNPTLADVSISMSVIIPDKCTDDMVAQGASKYSEGAKDVLAAANLVFAVAQVADLIKF